MEQLWLNNLSDNGRLPILNIKENVKSHSNKITNLPAYLSDDILTNIQQCNDGLVSSHEGKISNLWMSTQRRDKFKHLSDNPICICGAGNDLTFLYDKLPNQLNVQKKESITNNEKPRKRLKKMEDKMIIKIPEILFPAEFTLSTHHGTQSIQFYDELFSTKPLVHNNHKICLPTMNPNTISNSIKTFQSLFDIFQKSGLDESMSEEAPTSLHQLLLLVKKEQDLYNTVFHGIIKETTVDCIERGELLSNIRQRYRNICVRVPEKVKAFHDRVVARKILDRRLTEELMRFQSTVSLLTSELSGVKDHEDNINQMCQRAKYQLKEAVKETKTNADLLREYHDLYEQQRHRLEKTVFQLETERDCWRTAAYRITHLVLDYYNLQPGITLVECECNAILLSQYFVDLLTTTDNQALSVIKAKTHLWHSEAQTFSLMLAIREDNLKSILDKEIEKINRFKDDFEDDYLNDQGQLIQPINRDETKKILNLISGWEKTMSDLSETFGGQSMMVEEENLKVMKRICLEYTDVAVELFNRHRNESDGSLYQEHNVLFEINKMIDRMMDQFMDQLTGDNGVADGIITLQTYLENWITRLANCCNESFFRPMPDSEWIRLKLVLDDWIGLLHESRNAIGLVKWNADGAIRKKLEVLEIIQSVDNWSQISSSGIESENLKLHEAIVNLKRNMVRWSSQIVLRLAPDFPTNSPEAKRAARMASASLKELQENASNLHDSLSKFTNYIISCSKDIVARLVQIKIDTQSEFPDSDSQKLLQLSEYSKSWIDKSNEVLREIMEIEYVAQTITTSANETVDASSTIIGDNAESEEEFDVGNLVGNLVNNAWMNNFGDGDFDEEIVEVPETLPSVEGVGIDYNVHSRLLIQDPNLPYKGNKFLNINKVDISIDLPQTEDAFRLIQIFEVLQSHLRSLNSEALIAENQCTYKELEVAKSKSYLESLEQTHDKLTKELDQMLTEKRQVLPTPALYSSVNTIERAISESPDRSITPKSVVSSKRRAPRHVKKNPKK